MAVDLILSQYLFALGRALPHWMVVFLATYLIWFLFIGVLLFVWSAYKRSFGKIFFQLIFVAAAALAVNIIISLVYFRFRPFVALNFLSLIEVSWFNKSFPSDHTATAFAGALMFLKYNKKVGAIVCAGAALVGLGRVLAGVHFVSDIAAGVLVALIAVTLARRLFREREV